MPAPGGLPWWAQGEPARGVPGGDPPHTATAAGSTHPTGMHCCYMCVCVCVCVHGRISGVRGARDVYPLRPISFIFMQFSAKIIPNNKFWHPPLGNPVSATGVCARANEVGLNGALPGFLVSHHG